MITMYEEHFTYSPHKRSSMMRKKLAVSMQGNQNKLSGYHVIPKINYIYALLDQQGKVVYVGLTGQPLHTRLLQHYAVAEGQQRQDCLSNAIRHGEIHGIRCLHVLDSYSKARIAQIHAICLYDTHEQGYNTLMPTIAKRILK